MHQNDKKTKNLILTKNNFNFFENVVSNVFSNRSLAVFCFNYNFKNIWLINTVETLIIKKFMISIFFLNLVFKLNCPMWSVQCMANGNNGIWN